MKLFTQKILPFTIILTIVTLLQACSTIQGKTPEAKRNFIKAMRSKTLKQFYQNKNIKNQVEKSAGYAVFSNTDINLIFAAFSGGYGLLHNNTTHQDTFMKMQGAGLGLGAGAKDYRILIVFHSQKALDYFLKSGWSVGANVDAAAKSEKKGGDFSKDGMVGDLTTYAITKNGLALQATVKGIKYWAVKELNNN